MFNGRIFLKHFMEKYQSIKRSIMVKGLTNENTITRRKLIRSILVENA